MFFIYNLFMDVMKVYKNLIFDFNGTLLDDCTLCLKILNVLCKKYNIKHVSKKYYKEIFTFPVINYYKTLGFDVSNDNFKKIGNEFHSMYNKLSYSEAKLFKNVKEILTKLKKSYTLICLSASLKETLVKQLKYYEIYDLFDYVVGLNDNMANSKEQVAIDFIKKENINPKETLLIGDSLHDSEVASAINASCVLIASGHTSKERLLKSNNDVIDKFTDLLKYLNN